MKLCDFTTLRERDQAVVAALEARTPVGAVAAQYGLGKWVVRTAYLLLGQRPLRSLHLPSTREQYQLTQAVLQRRAEVVARIEAGETQTAVAHSLGITRERVHQIWRAAGRGSLLALRRAQNPPRVCSSCGKVLWHTTREGQENRRWQERLCLRCRIARQSRVITCIVCGGSRTILPHLAKRQKGLFCSRRCQGVYASQHYGFPAHPENRRKGGVGMTPFYSAVVVALQNSGTWSTPCDGGGHRGYACRLRNSSYLAARSRGLRVTTRHEDGMLVLRVLAGQARPLQKVAVGVGG